MTTFASPRSALDDSAAWVAEHLGIVLQEALPDGAFVRDRHFSWQRLAVEIAVRVNERWDGPDDTWTEVLDFPGEAVVVTASGGHRDEPVLRALTTPSWPAGTDTSRWRPPKAAETPVRVGRGDVGDADGGWSVALRLPSIDIDQGAGLITRITGCPLTYGEGEHAGPRFEYSSSDWESVHVHAGVGRPGIEIQVFETLTSWSDRLIEAGLEVIEAPEPEHAFHGPQARRHAAFREMQAWWSLESG